MIVRIYADEAGWPGELVKDYTISNAEKEEALTHIHSILLLIILEMERNGTEIPKDEIHPKSIPIDVDTATE